MEILVYVDTHLLDLDPRIDSGGSRSGSTGSADTDNLDTTQGTPTDRYPGETNSHT